MLVQERFPQSLKHTRLAIAFLQMGGPETLNDIEQFLQNLFSDPNIIQLPFIMKPFQSRLARFIAKKRAPHVQELYKKIGNGSPIKENTAKFTKTVESIIKKEHEHVKCFFIMRYSPPRAKNVLQEILQFNPTHLVLFTLYPHYSKTTTGSSLNDWYATIQSESPTFLSKIQTIEINDWTNLDAYLQWWVKHIKAFFMNLSPTQAQETAVLFSAHGIPERYVKQGDPYETRVTQAFNLITTRLYNENVKLDTFLSFQSSVGPIKWLQPSTQEKIKEIAHQGYKHLIMVPLGFVSEHLETLYEMDILYKQEAENLGFQSFYRVPTPNTDPEFASQIASYIINILREKHA